MGYTAASAIAPCNLRYGQASEGDCQWQKIMGATPLQPGPTSVKRPSVPAVHLPLPSNWRSSTSAFSRQPLPTTPGAATARLSAISRPGAVCCPCNEATVVRYLLAFAEYLIRARSLRGYGGNLGNQVARAASLRRVTAPARAS